MLTQYIDTERLTHSIKTMIACIIGYVLIQTIQFSSGGQWIVITIIIVMCAQIYVGGAIQKAYFRFLGTVLGCFFAASTLLLFGDNVATIIASISISCFIFSYAATGRESFAYTGTLGAATTAIIMLANTPTIWLALERFSEISIGLLIATLVSQFILPIHARAHLRKTQIACLQQLHDYYLTFIINNNKNESDEVHSDFDENIIKSLVKQRQLSKESIREPLGVAFNQVHFMRTLNYEKEILRAMTFMHIALLQSVSLQSIIMTSPAALQFHQDILQLLNAMIRAITITNPSSSSPHLIDLNFLKDSLLKNTDTISSKELMTAAGFLFSAEVLTENLVKLANAIATAKENSLEGSKKDVMQPP